MRMSIWLVALCLAVSTAAFAVDGPADNQTIGIDVQEVAVAGVSGPVTLTLNGDALTAGEAPVDTDASTYLRYTSIVPTGKHRRVTAQVTVMPLAGTQLSLFADTAAGANVGTVGTAVYSDYQVLNNGTPLPAVNMIQGVGSGYTGTDAGDGAKLHYKLSVRDWKVLAAGTKDATVTFTVTAPY